MNGFDLSTISNCYVGGAQASAIYLGSQLIWPATGPTPPHDYSQDYLTFTSNEDNNVIKWNYGNYGDSNSKTISISTNNGLTWINKTSSHEGTVLATLNTNDKLLVKGSNSSYGADSANHNYFSSTKKFDISGNIMSLIYANLFTNKFTLQEAATFELLFANCTGLISANNLILPATTLNTHCYSEMFQGCTNLVNIPALPATTLTLGCYSSMFHRCTSLTTAPELPATTLGAYCYSGMFDYCTSLTTAPALPATTLEEYCYNEMFYGCSSLITVPALPATTLEEYCYNEMFRNCTSLVNAPTLPATTLAKDCYAYMFQGCSSLNNITCLATSFATNSTFDWLKNVSATGTFTKASSMNDWTTGASGIPNGWTIQNA